jgi:hypothetical protein
VLKLLLIGDMSVGKSCLLLRSVPFPSPALVTGVPRLTLVRRGRFAEGRFEPDMMATMGIDFRLKDIDVRALILFFPDPSS